MCRLVPLLLLTVLLPASPHDEVKREWTHFEGTWLRVAYEADGQKVSEKNAQRFRLILQRDGKYTVRVDNKVIVEGTAVIDPTRKPKTIDMTPTTGRMKGETLKGIYELDGDDYRICYAPAGKERPEKFATGGGKGYVLAVYKRERK